MLRARSGRRSLGQDAAWLWPATHAKDATVKVSAYPSMTRTAALGSGRADGGCW
jgi:hypothetical protein